MKKNRITNFGLVISKNLTYRKRRWFQTTLQILIPVTLFILFAFIRSKIDNLEKKIIYDAFYTTVYSDQHLYNDKFNHETKLYYTPCNEFTSDLMYRVQVKFYLNVEAVRCFESEQDLLSNVEYDHSGTMAVIFKNLTSNSSPEQLSYEIRPYQEHVHWDTNKLFRTESTYTPDLGSSKYLYHGFLAFQMALETSYVELLTNKDLPFTIMLQEFPYPPHTDKSGTMDMLNYILPLATVLSFTFSCAMFVPRMIEDKASGMKEFLKIHGMKSWMILMGWFFDEFMINIVTTGVIVTFLKVPLFSVATAPIENCDTTLIILFLTLYSISTISFCVALSCFFNKSTYSIAVTLVIWILSYIIPNFVVCSNINLFSTDLLYGIFPNGVLVFGFKIMSVYEIRNTRSSWDNIFEPPSGGSCDLTIGHVLLMFLINILFYVVIISYKELDPYSICKRYLNALVLKINNKGSANNRQHTNSFSEHKILIEKEVCKLPVSIQIKGLTKRFGNNVVVNDVSLDIYNEQITVLLGRNGAGKTTMLSMITGMLKPTSGTITFANGDDTSISFCPQHNLQFSSLTVKEHLEFFGRLKGLSKKEAIENRRKLLELTSLTSKKNEFVCNLSEGMRRKLSLAIAVVGESKVIILDEPSSGLDPEVRRDIWNFIITLRGFRTLIVTTHLMEEAEALSDQIIIINNGCVVEDSSPLYLSKKYGIGYKVHLDLTKESKNEKIMKIAEKYKAVPQLTKDAKTIKILYDKPNKDQLSNMLKELEDNQEDLAIKNVILTHTTLEDVFLKAVTSSPETNCNNIETKIDVADPPKKIEKNCKIKFFIILKKWISFTNWRIILLQILTMIILMTTLLFLGERQSQTNSGENLLEFNLSKYGETKVFYNADSSDPLYEKLSKFYSNIIHETFSIAEKVDNVSTAIIEEGIKNIEFYKKHMIVSAEFITKKGHNIVKAMYSNSAIHGSPMSLNLLLNAILKTLVGEQHSISLTINPFQYHIKNKLGHIYTVQLIFIWCTLLPLAMVLISSLFIVIPQIERACNLKQLQLMCGISRKQYWFTCYLWNLILYTVIIFIALCCTSLINYFFVISKIFQTKEIVSLLVILLAYGVAILPYSYLYTYGKSKTSSLGFFVVFNLIASHILMAFVLYLESSQDDCLKTVLKYFTHFLHLFLVFGLQHTIDQFVKKSVWNYNWMQTSVERREAICRSTYNPCCDDDIQQCYRYQTYLNNEGFPILTNIFDMLASTAIYVTILFLTEMQWIKKTKKLIFNKNSNTQKTLGETLDNKPSLEAIDLSKKYKNKEAVKDISFNIPRNECLGLLGANGAGKTTISRLLAEEEIPDSGHITRYNINNVVVRNQNEFGYCPQIDCSTALSSGKTLLEFFGELRGVTNVNEEVKRLVDTFDLNECADKLCSTYSGGNKRKLGTAIAIIGQPDLILLDEPTAGVDPISRQKMRNELKSTKERSSMIISTHIIEDCERLCNEVAVLKNGEILDRGLISELKNKYNQAVTIKLKIKDGNFTNDDKNQSKRKKIIKELQEWEMEESKDVKNLKEAFLNTFSSCDLKDQHATLLKYTLEMSNVRYNNVFHKVEQLKRQHSIIEDYKVITSTLEDVFVSISNK